MIKFIAQTVFLTILLQSTVAQEIKMLEPMIGPELDFSPEFIKKFNSEESFIRCQELWKKIESEGRSDKQLKPEEKEILKYCDEGREEVWDIIGAGCSWYCGGGPKDVTASSCLKSQGENNYEPKNAHDLSYLTAWVEGVSGYGIGEFLVYRFAPESPRINKIIVVNGYVKSKSTWENNSRVKKLKMYIDEKPYAILNLKNDRAEQSFDVEPIGYSDRKDFDKLKKKPEWTIKFEIIEVYKGLKYDDVAITEIYFDGLDVHCLAKGTKVLMPGMKTINIEDLNAGDSILTFDTESNKLWPAAVYQTDSVSHTGLVTYHFASGRKITVTQDHPFLIDKKGWASLQPIKSKRYIGFTNMAKIDLGDYFITIDQKGRIKYDALLNIEYFDGEQITYTITELSYGDSFVANGKVVGVEQLPYEK